MGVYLGTKRIEIGMGYGTFMQFRKEVANAVSEAFGATFSQYLSDSMEAYFKGDKAKAKELEKQFDEYVSVAGIDEDVVDFLFLPDCEGKIDYKVARKIRDLCRKSKCEESFGYSRNKMTMREISEIFDDAVKHHCNVSWF